MDYGAVRDFGQSDPATKFVVAADASARADSRHGRDLEDLQTVATAEQTRRAPRCSCEAFLIAAREGCTVHSSRAAER